MWFEVAAVTLVMVVGVLTICFGACAWMSPRVLDWVATHADARAFSLRQYRMNYAAYVEAALTNRANNATQMEAENGVRKAKLTAGF